MFKYYKVGVENARTLALEYCRRGTYFVKMWVAAQRCGFSYTQAQVSGYTPSVAFTALYLTAGEDVAARVGEVEDMRPTIGSVGD